jgi:hypothetical protein
MRSARKTSASLRAAPDSVPAAGIGFINYMETHG